MNRNDPDIRSQLCGEYVLGTLSPRVRRRFERWLSEDVTLAAQVRDWRERLDPLYDMVPEQRPPERVWQAVFAEIKADAGDTRPSWWYSLWDSTATWRGIAMAASLLLVVLVGWVALDRSGQFERAPVQGGTRTVAVLADGEQRAVWLVELTPGAGPSARATFTIRTLMPPAAVASKSLELWAIPVEGAPVSMGLLDPNRTNVQLLVPADTNTAAGAIKALAVSVEPTGGSPTGAPTGPITHQGAWLAST